MSIKQSLALKKRWAKVSPEDRSKAMGFLAELKWKSIPIKDRRKHALTMVKAKRCLIAKNKR